MELRLRDLLMLLLSLCGILLSISIEGDYALGIVWNLPLPVSLYANNHFPLVHERIPPPLIADLNEDGRNEIIVVTRDPEIQIHEFNPDLPGEKPSDPSGKLVLKRKSSLLLETRVTSRRQPAAVATGYLDLAENKGPRQRFIVVLTQGWDVICFDSSLKVVWEASVTKSIPADYYISEAAILIAPGGTYGESTGKGVVVVGGRMSKIQDSKDIEVGHEHHERVGVTEEEGEEIAAAENEHFDAHAEEYTHFSHYAFEGKTGKKLWSHESGDYHNEESGPAEEGEFIQSHYKVDVRIPLKHEGESDWRQFRHSLIESLPHRWRSTEDTSLRLATFRKNKATKGKSKGFHKEITGLTLDVDFNALTGAAQEEKTVLNKGNVVVSMLHDGIEVLQLHSGRPLCQIPLAGDHHGKNGIYADINGDGVIDHVTAVTGKSTLDFLRGRGKVSKPGLCLALAVSGIPPTMQLFNGSLCNKGGPVDEFFENAAHYMEEGLAQSEETKEEIQAVDPVLVPTNHRLTTFSSHHQVYDSVFLVSNGLLTSYGPSGVLNWQLETASGWSKSEQKSAKFSSKVVGAHNMMDFSEKCFRPSLETFSSDALSMQEKKIVATGWHKMTIAGPRGNVLADFNVPEPPIASPVFGDMTGDGNADIILISRNGLYGIKVDHRKGSAFISYLLYTLIGVLLVVFIRQALILPREAKKKSLHRGTD